MYKNFQRRLLSFHSVLINKTRECSYRRTCLTSWILSSFCVKLNQDWSLIIISRICFAMSCINVFSYIYTLWQDDKVNLLLFSSKNTSARQKNLWNRSVSFGFRLSRNPSPFDNSLMHIFEYAAILFDVWISCHTLKR